MMLVCTKYECWRALALATAPGVTGSVFKLLSVCASRAVGSVRVGLASGSIVHYSGQEQRVSYVTSSSSASNSR